MNVELEFPCDYQFKIIGDNDDRFVESVTELFANHTIIQNTSKKSKKSNYLSISITIVATDRTSIDALYNTLQKHPMVKLVL